MKVDRLAASAADPGDHCLSSRIVQVGYDHLRTLARPRRGTGCTDSGFAAGYDANLALYLAHTVLHASCLYRWLNIRYGGSDGDQRH